jgi:hypothetical protein
MMFGGLCKLSDLHIILFNWDVVCRQKFRETMNTFKKTKDLEISKRHI